MDENGTQRRGQRKLAGVPRAVAMVSLVMFIYGELAERVYPFVLLPHLGVTLRVVLLTLFAVVHATLQFGLRTGILMFFATAFVTWLFEQVGVVTGTVYGAYHYSGMLGPKVGEVPLLIPLAWFMMIYPSYVVTSLIIDGRPLPDKTNLAQLGTRALVAAFVMTAWDAVIDPGMARSGFWVWEHGGSYFGVPRQNFAGWLLTTFIVYIVGRRDLVAGTTVAAIAIPQAMAYALIAGVDPRFGLYSAIIVTLVASIFGSSSHLINGPTNAISLVVFSALAGFEARFDAYQAMFLLAVIVGIIQILIAVFKLGDLTCYISESVVLGFMAGAGLLIAIDQVGNFLGVSRTRGGDHSVLGTLWETITQSGPYNYYAVGLGLGTLAGALQKEGVTVLLAGVRSNLAKVLRNLSFEKMAAGRLALP